jgi:hypothetical protein
MRSLAHAGRLLMQEISSDAAELPADNAKGRGGAGGGGRGGGRGGKKQKVAQGGESCAAPDPTSIIASDSTAPEFGSSFCMFHNMRYDSISGGDACLEKSGASDAAATSSSSAPPSPLLCRLRACGVDVSVALSADAEVELSSRSPV